MSRFEPSENIEYDDVMETIWNDAKKLNMTDDEIWATWQAGKGRRTTHESDPAEPVENLRWTSSDGITHKLAK